MTHEKGGGSLNREGVASSPLYIKSLMFTQLQSHCGNSEICDGGRGNSLACSFTWLSQMKLCSVAAAVTRVLLATKFSEQRELGSCFARLVTPKQGESISLPQVLGTSRTWVPSELATHPRTEEERSV
jgi:hypothetical protein